VAERGGQALSLKLQFSSWHPLRAVDSSQEPFELVSSVYLFHKAACERVVRLYDQEATPWGCCLSH
jgi:hypothetical protein